MTQHDYQQQVKHWVETHHGQPVAFDFPDAQADKSGVRIDFPGTQDEILHNQAVTSHPISWDEFFDFLDKQNLIFVYDQEANPETNLANSYRFERQV